MSVSSSFYLKSWSLWQLLEKVTTCFKRLCDLAPGNMYGHGSVARTIGSEVLESGGTEL